MHARDFRIAPVSRRGKPLGWGSDADWAGTIAVLKQYVGVSAPLTTAQLYTERIRSDRGRRRAAAGPSA
jgi:hypothetical protein